MSSIEAAFCNHLDLSAIFFSSYCAGTSGMEDLSDCQKVVYRDRLGDSDQTKSLLGKICSINSPFMSSSVDYAQ